MITIIHCNNSNTINNANEHLFDHYPITTMSSIFNASCLQNIPTWHSKMTKRCLNNPNANPSIRYLHKIREINVCEMTLQEKQLDTAMQVHPESPVKSGKMQGTFKKAVTTIKVSNVIGNDVRNKRLLLREARESAYDETRISIRRLEMAQHQGLVLPTEDGTVVEDSERDEQAKIIRGMAIPMTYKRKLRFGSHPGLTQYSVLLS